MKALVRLSCSLMLVVCFPLISHSTPLGPGFTYQGQLVLNGNPVNGIANLRFSLWDAAGSGSPPAGGTQIGASQITPNVSVTNGLFVVQLNDANQFGVTPFNGDARWLQVEVCTDGTCATVTTLAPRQPLLATPQAQYAGPWRLLGGNAYFINGNVGIGTANPGEKLTIAGDMELGTSAGDYRHFRIGGGNSSGFLYGSYPALADGIHMGYNFYADASGAPHIIASGGQTSRISVGYGYVALATGGTNTTPANRLVVATNGNVGIGTDTPAERLTVAGNISLGPNGEFDALAGEEKLRIIRGLVTGLGTPERGCCFSVVHLGTGLFQINFTRPFSDAPIVVATAIIHPNYNAVCRVIANDTGFATIEVKNGSDLVDWSFHFIAAGPR